MSDALVELDGVSQRVESITWELLDSTLSPIGTLNPSTDRVPTIDNNSNRTIKRTMSGLVLTPDDYDAIDPLTDRIRPSWVIEGGDTYPLGVFMFGDVSRSRFSYGYMTNVSMVDQCLILDQPIFTSISFAAGTLVSDAIEDVCVLAGLPTFTTDATSYLLGSPMSWQIGGGDTPMKVLTDLAQLAGFYAPYFDNDGVLTFESVPNVDAVIADFDFDTAHTIVAGSIVETNDILAAPNRYVVVDSSNSENLIGGYYDLPDTAPHSIANRGFIVVATYDTQGLADNAQASAVAEARANADSSTYQWADVETTPDPRFDTHDIVAYNGYNWRSQSWSLRLQAGGQMRHSLRRQFASV